MITNIHVPTNWDGSPSAVSEIFDSIPEDSCIYDRKELDMVRRVRRGKVNFSGEVSGIPQKDCS